LSVVFKILLKCLKFEIDPGFYVIVIIHAIKIYLVAGKSFCFLFKINPAIKPIIVNELRINARYLDITKDSGKYLFSRANHIDFFVFLFLKGPF